jgi:hypothetical protein
MKPLMVLKFKIILFLTVGRNIHEEIIHGM